MATKRTTERKTYDEATLAARRARQRQIEDARRLRYPSAWMDPGYYADPANAYTASYLTSMAASSPLQEATWYRQQTAAAASMLVPEQELALLQYLDTGVISPGIAAGITEAARSISLDPDTIQAISSMDSLAIAASNEQAAQGKQASEAEEGKLARFLGNITRPVFALLSMPGEYMGAAMRNVSSIVQNEGWGGLAQPIAAHDDEDWWTPMWEQTTGGQLIRGWVDPKYSPDMGSGWFPGGEVHARQVMATRSAAPLVHGKAWTPGRGVASLIFNDPEDLRYRNVSGLIDLVSVVATDPLVITGGVGAGTRAAQTGRRTAEAVRIGETTKAAQAEQALGTAEAWLKPTTDYIREATKLFTHSQKNNGQYLAAGRHAAAVDRYDDATDLLALARSDAAMPPRATLTEVEVNSRLRTVLDNFDADEIGALNARVAGDAPDLPGVFTREMPAQSSSLPGSHDGVDAIVTVLKDNPRLVSFDDLADTKALIAAVRASKAPKAAKSRAVKAIREAGDQASFGDLIEAALRSRTGGTLTAALRQVDVDGITDAFRVAEKEGGVWWITPDVDVIKWVDGSWQHIDPTEAAKLGRVAELEKGVRSATSQKGKATQDMNGAKRVATELADQYSRVMNGKLDIKDADMATRTAVEYSLGVRRNLGGKPDIDTESIKAFLLGDTRAFESQTAIRRSASEKAITAADRALIGAVTLGVSEGVRAAKKLAANPMMMRARQNVLDGLVKLSDTPENLGRLHRLTGGKMHPAAIRAALRAKNEDEVLSALGPYLGVSIDRPISPGLMNLPRTKLTEVTTGRANTHLFNRGIRWMVDETERLGTIAPRGLTSLNFADVQGSAATLRNYVDNVPFLDIQVRDKIMGNYLSALDEPGRAKAVMDGFDSIYDAIATKHGKDFGWSDETVKALNTSLKDATQIYDGGRAEVNTFWTRRYVANAKASVMTIDGQRVQLPGPQLEAELARGGVVLPDMQRLRDSMGRWGAYLEDSTLPLVNLTSPEKVTKIAHKARDVISTGNDVWRSSILFRPAYVVRNIGEMQSRMFLAGSSSVFNHPLAVASFAAAVAKNKGPIKSLMARFARANTTITGKEFSAADIEDIRGVDEAVDLFNEVVTRTSSRLDMRTHRAMEAFHGLEEVSIGKPGFNLGLAEQLLMLRSDRLARVVAGFDPPEVARLVSRGMDRQDAVVSWVLSSPQGRAIRLDHADATPDFVRIFGNPRTGTPGDPVAMKEFLFTAEGSIAKRVDYYTAGNGDLRSFIATGVLRRGEKDIWSTAIPTRDPRLYQEAMAKRTRELSKNLRGFTEQIAKTQPDKALYMRVMRFRGGEKPFQFFNNLFDSFFSWSGRMENAIAVGPEFAYSYYRKVAELLPAMKKADRQQAFDAIKAAEGKLRTMSETMHAARKGLGYERDGMLTLDDVNTAAAQYASEHVKTFFYDAMRRQQIFHALRVVFPFAQSFVDTLWRWGSLAAQKPYMVEKVGRLGMGLSEPGSNVIYDDFDFIDPFTNRESADPTQGFLWNDPQTGEQMFSFPLIGSMLGAVLSPVAGQMAGEPIDLAESMQLVAPLRNLNIALQGDVDYLPGAGPILTLPMNVIFPDDAFGAAPEWLRDYLFPYGKLDYEGGLLEATLFPTWARRLVGAMWGETYRQYAVKGSMAYLMSSREYPNFRNDPAQAEQFVEDTRELSSWMSFIRAFGAFVLPAAPTQEIYVEDTDGGLIGAMYLSDRWNDLMEATGRDTEKATAALIDTYGLTTLGAIAGPSYESDVPFSTGSWEFFKANPQRNMPYIDTLGYFFPGDYSMEANQWIRQRGSRRGLSVDKRADNLLEFLYFAERRMLEGRAAEEGWDAGAIRQAEDELNESYAGVIPTFEIGNAEREIAKIRRTLKNLPELQATKGGQGAALIFEAYDSYIEEAESRWGPGSSLTSERATPLRESFLTELDRITAEYGGLDLENGSVDTIAGMFARLVEPREE